MGAETAYVPRSRMRREGRTVAAMMRVYCRAHHGTRDKLCGECDALLQVAWERLKKCRYRAAKPTCAHCPTHCYRKAQREQIRAVMRFAGPRMLYRHPVLAVLHLLDGFRRKLPDASGKRRNG
ncbi:MAG: nitrous oxide-stimulated promoter family protein [Candidatus Latescibacterota bacterium]